jgi:hypothetical protein
MFKLRALTHSRFFVYLFHYPSLFIGLCLFVLTRKTPWISYWSMRKIYAVKGPGSIDVFSRFGNAIDYKSRRSQWAKKSIFNYTENDVAKFVDTVERDGYCILPFSLPESYVTELTRLATDEKCDVRQSSQPGTHRINLASPVGPWYQLPERDLLKNKTTLELAKDSLFLDIAKGYLGETPVNDLIFMWWTLPYKNADQDLLAQMYHFDLDRLKFLKFFFYLTDVDMTNGPHCFIKGSHTNKSDSLRQDRRYTDEEIFKNYGTENEVIMTGKKGLILVEDTRGFHKGLNPKQGHRLMFQLEYATSLFGQAYTQMDLKSINPGVYDQFKAQPTIWQRFI